MRAIILFGVTLLLTACAALVPKLETPRLSVVNVELLESSLFEQRLRVRMRVQNPNDRALPIRGLSYALEVSGEEFAHGVSDNSFTVPALGEAEFDSTISVNMATTLLRLLGRGNQSSNEPIPYRITGRLSLAEGMLRYIPFEQSGKFQLN